MSIPNVCPPVWANISFEAKNWLYGLGLLWEATAYLRDDSSTLLTNFYIFMINHNFYIKRKRLQQTGEGRQKNTELDIGWEAEEMGWVLTNHALHKCSGRNKERANNQLRIHQLTTKQAKGEVQVLERTYLLKEAIWVIGD